MINFSEEQKKELEKFIAFYGKDSRIDIAIEEMSELTKALCKERRYRTNLDKYNDILENLTDEMADVYIMLEQLMVLFGNEDNISEHIQQKIQRQSKRLEEDQSHEEQMEISFKTPKNCKSCPLNGAFGCVIAEKRDMRKNAETRPEWCPAKKKKEP